jgi:glycosyltransferase involved in cell wall biosynthesis
MSTFTKLPLVSIGVPAFNSEKYISKALDSLLCQSLRDFEVIISDNASADRTQAICEEYLLRDKRIRYYRQKRNIGAPRNWNFVFNMARGSLFKWASANDYCSSEMLEKCVSAIQSNPDVVLCYGLTQLIDENDKPIEVYTKDKSFNDDRPSKRFFHVTTQLSLNNMQCGVFKSDVLRRSGLDRLYPSGDISLMSELSLYGKFKMIPDVLLFRRQSSGTFSSLLTPIELQRFYDPAAKSIMKLILFRRHIDNIISITRAPISISEKIRAYRISLRLAKWDRLYLWSEFVSFLSGLKRVS